MNPYGLFFFIYIVLFNQWSKLVLSNESYECNELFENLSQTTQYAFETYKYYVHIHSLNILSNQRLKQIQTLCQMNNINACLSVYDLF